MKYLVTGGGGFIGSHLVDKLLKDGNKVVVLDDFTMGERFNLHEIDSNLTICNASILDKNMDLSFDEVDVVFHLAALTRPRESFVNPFATNRVNVEGTLKVLMAAKDYKVKKFIFVSSASAYGYQDRYPFFENMVMKPASPYALTKLIGEQYCQLFEKISEMKINRVRPFNVYGPRQKPDGPYAAAIPKFIDRLSKDKKPYITGTGKQFRDFVYVKDVVDLLFRVSESDIEGEVFNAGSGTRTSINALYETVCGLMKKDVVPDHKPDVDDPNTLANIEKAERLLYWRPKYSLVEGLSETIDEKKNRG